MRVSLGIQNNNPFNLRYNPLNRWKGMIGQNKGFCVFESMDYGIRAGIITLRTYINKYHLTDVASIIERFAPPAENPTSKYISYVSSYLRSRGHTPDIIRTIHYDSFYSMCVAMLMFESWFRCSESDIIRVINKFKL